MKIALGLKNYIYNFPYFKFNYAQHARDNSPSMCKEFVRAASKTPPYRRVKIRLYVRRFLKRLVNPHYFYLYGRLIF